MPDQTPAGPTASIVERAKAILLKPAETWPVIERDPTPSGDIFTRYVLPLAAIGPVATFLGGQLFGYGALFVRFRPSFMSSLSMALGTFVLSLVSLIVLTFIAGKLSTQFGGQSSSRNAFKLVAFSMTASWLSAVFALVPALGLLSLLGLYSLYLFYVGAGPMMKVPSDKVMPYTVVTVICAIVLNILVGTVAATVGGVFGGVSSALSSSSTSEGGTLSIPGVGKIDTGEIEQAAKQVEQAGKDFQSGNGKAVAPAALQALLPATLGGLARESIESEAAGPASHAEARYSGGDRQVTLEIADLSVMGALAGMGAAMGVESNKEDADGYERTTTAGGGLVTEKWDKSSGEGSYGMLIGKRFMVTAKGNPENGIDGLKQAVAAVDPGKLAALVK